MLHLEAGKKYRLRYTVDLGNLDPMHVIIFNPADGSYTYPAETGLGFHDSGEKMGTFTAAADELELRFQLPQIPAGADSVYCWLDNIYLEEVVAYVPGGGAEGDGGYRYGFNGQEKSTEINGSENFYTAAFWQYDSRLGRRWNVDPKPTVGISNYAAFANNPIFYTDVLGDTTYRFNMKGSFLGMVDLEIAGISGVAGNMSQVKGEDGKLMDQFNPEENFNFNDPSLDRVQLNKMKIGDHGLTFLNDENINAVMSDAGVSYEPNIYTRWSKAAENSPYSKIWDFSYSYLLPASGLKSENKIPDGDTKGGFFLMGNTSVAYNINDAGNWLWGQSMNRIGIGLRNAKLAAHANSVRVGDGWDSPADQSAIGQGYIYRVQTKNAIYNRIFLADPVKQNANSPKQWGH